MDDQPTSPPSPSPGPDPAPRQPGSGDNGRVIAGVILIVLGLGLFAQQFVPGLSGGVFLLLIGAVFTAFYFWRRVYGLLIPGCILMGLGLGQIAADSGSLASVGNLNNIGLGVGFVAIYVIDLIYRGHTHWWPLVPGLLVALDGFAQGNPAFKTLVDKAWPLVLVIIGLAILAGASGLAGRKSER